MGLGADRDRSLGLSMVGVRVEKVAERHQLESWTPGEACLISSALSNSRPFRLWVESAEMTRMQRDKRWL